MLTDYVLKSIDNLFAKQLSSPKVARKALFNRQTIKESIGKVVRHNKENHVCVAKGTDGKIIPYKEKETTRINQGNSHKSRLRIILDHNKRERLKSVIRRHQQLATPKQGKSKQGTPKHAAPKHPTSKQSTPKNGNFFPVQNLLGSRSPSPYQKIGGSNQKLEQLGESEKRSDIIKYYREQRKSIQKSRTQSKSQLEQKKQRIFLRDPSVTYVSPGRNDST